MNQPIRQDATLLARVLCLLVALVEVSSGRGVLLVK